MISAMMIKKIIKTLFLLIFALSFCACLPETDRVFDQKNFLDALSESEISFNAIPNEANLELNKYSGSAVSRSTYQTENLTFLLLVCESSVLAEAVELDDGSPSQIYRNENLVLIINKGSNREIISTFDSLKQPLSYKQAGVFIYPLGVSLLLAVFVMTERMYSLRPGLTFPRKVKKALRTGEFPNKKWKKKSAAERIVHVALHEKPSQEALIAYSRLEVSSFEKGLFILEVIVAGAPLIGLLGTATGLVQVFSAMPAGGLSGGTEVFAEGIALALLTTIIGLAIAIPALIGHAYLYRIVEKRTASIEWLTARLIDAIGDNKFSHNS